MSNFSDWTTNEYVNDTAPAINASNLNKNENALEDVMDELNYSHGWSLKNILDYALDNSVKQIDVCEDADDYSTTGTVTVSTVTDVICGISGVKLVETDNTASGIEIDKEVTPADTIDLTEFWSGATSTSNDYIGVIFYCSDDTKFQYIIVRLGINSSNYYYHYFGGVSFSTGWNFSNLKKDDFASYGSPDWSDVQWIGLGAYTESNAQNEYIIFNKVALIRRDGTYNTSNPWFMNDGDDNYDELPYISPDDDIDTVVCLDNRIGKKGFFQCITVANHMSEIFSDINSFSFKCEVYSKSDGYGPSIIWYIDSSNHLRVDVVGSELIIYEKITGVEVERVTKSLTLSIVANDRMELWIEKTPDTIIRVRLEVDGQDPIHVAWSTTFSATAYGTLGFTVYNAAQYYFVTDFVVGHNQNSLPPFMAKSSPIVVRKFFDQGLTSSTTLQDDDELFVKLPAYSSFEVIAIIVYAADSTIPNIKVAWDNTGTGDIFNYGDGRLIMGGKVDTVTNTNVSMIVSDYAYTTSVPYGVISGAELFAIERLTLYTESGGGYLQLQWAQNTSSSDELRVKKGSYIKVLKL